MSDVITVLAMEANDKTMQIARLKAENAKLREQGARLFDKTLELGTDNAKLRELALGLKWCSENYGCENLCPLYDKSEPEHCREERLLRELGIEVDG